MGAERRMRARTRSPRRSAAHCSTSYMRRMQRSRSRAGMRLPSAGISSMPPSAALHWHARWSGTRCPPAARRAGGRRAGPRAALALRQRMHVSPFGQPVGARRRAGAPGAACWWAHRPSDSQARRQLPRPQAAQPSPGNAPVRRRRWPARQPARQHRRRSAGHGRASEGGRAAHRPSTPAACAAAAGLCGRPAGHAAAAPPGRGARPRRAAAAWRTPGSPARCCTSPS